MTPLILIAEDDADIRGLLKLYLEGEGLRVLEAADGTDALALAREHTPDMAILDIMMPGMNGFFMLIDGGANVDCRPEMLLQFGVMGSAYMKNVMGIEKPRVALANVGTEEHKGDQLRQEALALLKACPDIHFVGNLEARDIPYNKADVVVADGFTGNMILKLYEGVAMALMDKIKGVFMGSVKGKLAAAMVYSDLKKMKKELDYNEYGGAPIMGCSKPVFKIHGSAKASTVESALRLARDYAQSGIIAQIGEAVGKKS